MRSVVTDTLRFVFGMPLVVAVPVKSKLVAEFFTTTLAFWGNMINFYLIFLSKEKFTPSAFSLLSLEKLAFGVVQHWMFAQSLAPVE